MAIIQLGFTITIIRLPCVGKYGEMIREGLGVVARLHWEIVHFLIGWHILDGEVKNWYPAHVRNGFAHERPLISTSLFSKNERGKTDNIDKQFYITLTPIP